MREDLEKMTDNELDNYEQALYELEVDGEDTWFERDQVLWEINYREQDREAKNVKKSL